MSGRRMRAAWLAAAVGLVAAGCGSSGGSSGGSAAAAPVMTARDTLNADLGACTQQFGYDPANQAAIAENALAPNELPWRDCARDAVRRYAGAHPALAGQYQQLIAADIEMTTAIEQGTMTRSERRTRLQAMIADIKAAEDAQVQASQVEQEKQMGQVRMVVDNFRGFY